MRHHQWASSEQRAAVDSMLEWRARPRLAVALWWFIVHCEQQRWTPWLAVAGKSIYLFVVDTSLLFIGKVRD